MIGYTCDNRCGKTYSPLVYPPIGPGDLPLFPISRPSGWVEIAHGPHNTTVNEGETLFCSFACLVEWAKNNKTGE